MSASESDSASSDGVSEGAHFGAAIEAAVGGYAPSPGLAGMDGAEPEGGTANPAGASAPSNGCARSVCSSSACRSRWCAAQKIKFESYIYIAYSSLSAGGR